MTGETDGCHWDPAARRCSSSTPLPQRSTAMRTFTADDGGIPPTDKDQANAALLALSRAEAP